MNSITITATGMHIPAPSRPGPHETELVSLLGAMGLLRHDLTEYQQNKILQAMRLVGEAITREDLPRRTSDQEASDPFTCPECGSRGWLYKGRLRGTDGIWAGMAFLCCESEQCGHNYNWRGEEE